MLPREKGTPVSGQAEAGKLGVCAAEGGFPLSRMRERAGVRVIELGR